MPQTSFVDMKRTKAEIKKNQGGGAIASPMSDHDKYPWGLEIDLQDESLKKLGIDVSKYKPGEKIQVIANASIESMRQSIKADGGKSQSMTLQITKMQLKPGVVSKATAPSQTSNNAEEFLNDVGHFDA